MAKQRFDSSSGGVVAAGDPRTAQVGAALLDRGGNAVDAAVGAQFAAFAVEPLLTGPFGGGFATVAGETIDAACLQFFAKAPGLGSDESNGDALDFRSLAIDFGPTDQVFHVGRGSVAISLMLPGLVELHSRYGKLALTQVTQPAIELATGGVRVSKAMHTILRILRPILLDTPSSRALFAPRGELLAQDDLFVSPDLAATLEALTRDGVPSITDRMLETFRRPHGAITPDDLRSLQITESRPLCVECAGFEIYLPPPPTSGGVLVGFGLKLLASTPRDVWQDEEETLRHLLGAMITCQEVRDSVLDKLLGESSGDLLGLAQEFVDDDNVDRWRPAFDRATRRGTEARFSPPPDLGSTTHISALDGMGLACSLTSSNGEGCGRVVPNTGAMANNFMGEDDLHPNGFHQLAPGTPLTSMMCPTVVTQDNQPVLALGTGGSNRIRTVLLQVLARTLFGGVDVAEAVESPRIHYEGGPLYAEAHNHGARLRPTTIESLRQLSQEFVLFEQPSMFFGGVHAGALREESVADSRRGGSIALARPASP